MTGTHVDWRRGNSSKEPRRLKGGRHLGRRGTPRLPPIASGYPSNHRATRMRRLPLSRCHGRRSQSTTCGVRCRRGGEARLTRWTLSPAPSVGAPTTTAAPMVERSVVLPQHPTVSVAGTTVACSTRGTQVPGMDSDPAQGSTAATSPAQARDRLVHLSDLQRSDPQHQEGWPPDRQGGPR